MPKPQMAIEEFIVAGEKAISARGDPGGRRSRQRRGQCHGLRPNSWRGSLGLALLCLSACDDARRLPTSAFTQAEVDAGRVGYHDYCSGCHRDDLRGGGLQGGSDAPPLTGLTFKSDWSKYSIQVLYHFVSKTMPAGLEGDLKPEMYSNIISFLLAANGAKPGPTAFNPNSSIKIGDIANGQTVTGVIDGRMSRP